MSFIVKGMNPPKSCYACSWYNKVECPVNDGRYYYRVQRHPSCPLTEIKEPHGDLVDRGALKNDMRDWNPSIIAVVDATPTVIEAEGSETDA